MAKDWTTDPAEIPEDGLRYDMTLDKIGATRDGPGQEERDLIVLKAVIDRGDHAGHHVSHVFDMDDGGFKQFQRFEHGVGHEGNWQDPDDWNDFVKPFRDVWRKLRFSAVLMVEPFETETERGVRYGMHSWDDPQADAELHLKTEPTQFKRNV